MKKLISLVLALALVLGLCASAMAAPFYLESADITVDVPDGHTAQDASNEATSVVAIYDDADSAVVYAVTVAYIDELGGKNLLDLSDEEAEELGMSIAAAIESPVLDEAELDGIPVLVIAAGDGTQLHYMALLEGWMFDVASAKNDGEALNDDQIAVTAYLLGSIEGGE